MVTTYFSMIKNYYLFECNFFYGDSCSSRFVVKNFKSIDLVWSELLLVLVVFVRFTKRMTTKMKLFQFTQMLCYSMGFFPSHSNSRHAFRWKLFLYLLPPILFFISSVLFLLTFADSMQDYVVSVSMITSTFICIVDTPMMIFNMAKILEVIEKFEELIETSEHGKERRNYKKKWLKYK